MRVQAKTKRLTVSAMLIAIAAADALLCQFIPFINFPFGGGVTLASMLPIVLLSYLYGVKWGLFCGFCYSFLQLFMGHSTVAALFLPDSDSYMGVTKALVICFIEYVLAYTLLGIGGLFRKTKQSPGKALAFGSVVALLSRYLCHLFSGWVFYGAWASWFFHLDGIYPLFGRWVLEHVSGNGLALFYSAVYNGAYMLPEIILTFALSFLVMRIPYCRETAKRGFVNMMGTNPTEQRSKKY